MGLQRVTSSCSWAVLRTEAPIELLHCSFGRSADTMEDADTEGLFPGTRRGHPNRWTSEVNKMSGNGNTAPLVRIQAGPVSCGIWENPIKVNGATKAILKASVSRRYKDNNGEWKSTGSFSRNEVPLAIFCLQKAWEKMIGEEGRESENGAVEEESAV